MENIFSERRDFFLCASDTVLRRALVRHSPGGAIAECNAIIWEQFLQSKTQSTASGLCGYRLTSSPKGDIYEEPEPNLNDLRKP
jgi:hypothetical protein